MSEQPVPGWYPDPQGAGGQQRWWNGTSWTEHTQQEQPHQLHHAATATATATQGDARTWAMVAHLSALPGAAVALAFIGPLIIYVLKKDDDPFVRNAATEALNFNLSLLLYTAVFVVLLFLIVGLLLIPVAILAAMGWLILVIVAGVKAGKGEAFRYPLTIRFVS